MCAKIIKITDHAKIDTGIEDYSGLVFCITKLWWPISYIDRGYALSVIDILSGAKESFGIMGKKGIYDELQFLIDIMMIRMGEDEGDA